MPRIDPDTGVEVMTIMEYFAKIGEQEGKTPTQVMVETYESMAAEEARYLAEIQTPAGALKLLTEVINKENENRARLREENKKWEETHPGKDPFWDDTEPYPTIADVLEVTGAWYSGGVKAEETILSARVVLTTGEVKLVKYTRSYWGGTMMSPPEEEIELVFEDIPNG